MILNIVITDENGKQKAICSNKRIIIQCRHKNSVVKEMSFQVEEGTGGHNWELMDTEE